MTKSRTEINIAKNATYFINHLSISITVPKVHSTLHLYFLVEGEPHQSSQDATYVFQA
jgi:hypothetical protein